MTLEKRVRSLENTTAALYDIYIKIIDKLEMDKTDEPKEDESEMPKYLSETDYEGLGGIE
jgi:hypothetical protein